MTHDTINLGIALIVIALIDIVAAALDSFSLQWALWSALVVLGLGWVHAGN